MLAAHARLARSPWAQLVGLIGRKVGKDEALGLPGCPVIHTFGVRQPLDAAFCDAAGRVLGVIAAIPPWRLAGPVPGAVLVWEARAGTLAPFVRPGDVLVLETG